MTTETIDIQQLINTLNSMNNAELRDWCKQIKAKQTIDGCSNKLCKRTNIFEKIVGRKITYNEDKQLEFG